MSTLLAPETRHGHGSAHLRRARRLLESIPDTFILLPEERTHIRTLVADIDPDRIVSTVDHSWDRIIVDRFDATMLEVHAFAEKGCTFGIDLGGEGREYCDYLIDTLPRLDRSRANQSDDRFLVLPDASRTPASTADPGLSPAVLLTFGGEDPAHLTEAAARLLARAGIPGVVAVAPSMRELGPLPSAVTVLPPQSSLEPLLRASGVVITSFGMTAYEARSLGRRLITIAPTRYHDRLARAAGFTRAGVGSPTRELPTRVRDRLAEPDAAAPLGTTARSLAEEIRSLSIPGRRGCPAHPVSRGRAVWRNAEKSYFRCPACGLVYLERFAVDEETYGTGYFMEEYRAQYGRTYLEDFDHIYRTGIGRVRSALSVAQVAPRTVLDVGCAYGPFLAAVRDHGLEPFGVDVAEDAVRYVGEELRIPVACSGILEFDPQVAFGRSTFDLVTMWYVVEHFDRLEPVLKKISHLMGAGGILAMSTPFGDGISARRSPETFYERSPRDHFTVWSKTSAKLLLSEYGFSVRRFVVTGHHPERYPGVRARVLPASVARLHSRLAGRGDTFEIYAVKEE